ncbi:3-oxoacyl-[acyl-carrier-protein] synthase III C-terminal domain-containing protein [Halarcobacter sp.]|uniref:3-oxoacyl-[acyl-carrier-protein] synthase III C-terminal domain-containing protein n=1 Tax=Halarcobacter sp. TaxID=2321133 RepID=UPI003B00B728
MAKSTFNKAKVSAIVTCVPENHRFLEDDIDTLYNGDIKQVNRIKKSIGLNKRHIVDGDVTTSDLCEKAANKLLYDMQVSKNEIDAIIFVSQTPDYFQPATAAYLQGKLDLSENCAAFDVNQGCAGYVYGLWLAHMMIETNSCSKVLLLAGDTLSKVVNPLDSNVATLFGDAGTATLIEISESQNPSFFTLHTNGKKFDTIIQPEGAFRKPSKKIINDERIFETSEKRSLKDFYMDGAAVFNFSIETEPKAIKEILEFSGVTQESIDYIIFHQANKYIISNIARRLKIPLDKAPSETTGKYGNQSSASIPSTICDAINNDVNEKELNLILSGFGVGLSWAACQLTLDKIYCPDIIYYK